MILNFKCYSGKRKDFDEVYYQYGRFRGCEKGNPLIVPGWDIFDSERNLQAIKDTFKNYPNIRVIENKRASFCIEIHEEEKQLKVEK